MQFSLKLEVNQQHESLERVLRVVRHRGFTLIQCQVFTDACGFFLHMTVSGSRTREFLVKQLRKLICVIGCEVADVGARAKRTHVAAVDGLGEGKGEMVRNTLYRSDICHQF